MSDNEVLVEIRRLRSDVASLRDDVDRRMTTLENRYRGLEGLFQQVLDEIASFRRSYNEHRHGTGKPE